MTAFNFFQVLMVYSFISFKSIKGRFELNYYTIALISLLPILIWFFRISCMHQDNIDRTKNAEMSWFNSIQLAVAYTFLPYAADQSSRGLSGILWIVWFVMSLAGSAIFIDYWKKEK